jgi:hypothetical protein
MIDNVAAAFERERDMTDGQWDEQFKRFLKRTGEDLKRVGNDMRTEAQRLMKEVSDPSKQKKVREGLKELGALARKAAEEVASVVEAGVKTIANFVPAVKKTGVERERFAKVVKKLGERPAAG